MGGNQGHAFFQAHLKFLGPKPPLAFSRKMGNKEMRGGDCLTERKTMTDAMSKTAHQEKKMKSLKTKYGTRNYCNHK